MTTTEITTTEAHYGTWTEIAHAHGLDSSLAESLYLELRRRARGGDEDAEQAAAELLAARRGC